MAPCLNGKRLHMGTIVGDLTSSMRMGSDCGFLACRFGDEPKAGLGSRSVLVGPCMA